MGHDKDQDGRKRMAVVTKIRSVSPIILPTLPVSFVLAMEPAMEKENKGNNQAEEEIEENLSNRFEKRDLVPKNKA